MPIQEPMGKSLPKSKDKFSHDINDKASEKPVNKEIVQPQYPKERSV